MAGVLLLDKPAGPTSFDAVARVKRALRARKVGHAGTLDPLATGLLVVCVEDAVKLQDVLTQGDKAYEAAVAFGAGTETEDAEGAVVERGDASRLDAAAVRDALSRFVGAIEQLPPMYSAVRVGGRRLHHAARAGEQVERAPRAVRVEALELLGFDPVGSDGLARARLLVRCSKGTYVRTLAADLGRSLGVPAHLAALRRTASGPFTVSEAITLDEVERLARADRPALWARLLPPAHAVAFLPEIRCTPREALDLTHGRPLAREAPGAGLCRALSPAGDLLALCRAEGGSLRPVRVFAPPQKPSTAADATDSPLRDVDGAV